MNPKHCLLATVLCSMAACSPDTQNGSTDLSIEFALTAVSGVAALHYEVTPADCDSGEVLGPSQTSDVALLAFPAPQVEGLTGFAEDSEHAFADALFVLDSGCYDVTVTPLDDFGAPSVMCSPASQSAVWVEEGVTTEILLVSQCNGRDFGGLDGVAIVNHAPQLDSVSLDPSAFVGCGAVQRLCASVTDPDGDPLEFAWSTDPANPFPAVPFVAERSVEGDTVTECVELVAEQAGDYEVGLVVFDLGLLNGVWTRIEDILATQPEPRASHYETGLTFHADCAPELSAVLSYTETTNNRYCASVEVENTGATATEGWSVVIQLLDSRLIAGSVADATLSSSGAFITATPLGGEGPLSPGESTSFRFCAKKMGPNPAAEIVSLSAP
jgi:hypothetical protein